MRPSFLLCLSMTDWCKEKKHEPAEDERVSSVGHAYHEEGSSYGKVLSGS